MGSPFLGEIRMCGYNFAPVGWAFCDGAVLSIAQNTALFDLIGTTYGGDGTSTFNLPDLRGRLPMHQGSGAGLSPRVIGAAFGEEGHTLLVNETPSHTHTLSGSSTTGTQTSPAKNVWGSDRIGRPYNSTGGGGAMSAASLAAAGGNQAHENRSPFLAINMIIALQGIFPSQN